MKQIQDAYIVAATRTPIGRSHKGSFKHLRSDDLLAHALLAVVRARRGRAGRGTDPRHVSRSSTRG